jgi:hypothetical protein
MDDISNDRVFAGKTKSISGRYRIIFGFPILDNNPSKPICIETGLKERR